MIDAPDAMRDYLLTQTAITDITSTRIWAERSEPNAGYKPSDGGGIAFRARGGAGLDYTNQLLRQSWQFKCYAADELAANTLYRALVDSLHQKTDLYIRSALLEIPGQTLREPDTDWPYVLTFFSTIILSGVTV